ncbi:MAG: hypothetical protein IJG68_07815 [Bacilli bacterium]|nr:hypothetical protein [Bacilli bacterium]
MKKVLWILLLLPVFMLNVYATSVPYQWIVDGETVNTKPNNAGTARLEKDGKKVTLFLNNYNGGKLQLDCYGTGQSDMEFIINLEGENTINSSDVGIDMGESASYFIDFQGAGTLVINAPKPISNEDAVDVYKVNIQEEEEPTKEESLIATNDEKEEPTKEESLIATNDEKEDDLLIDTKDDNNKEDNDWLVRILGGLLIVSIGIISFLVVKLNQKKNAN